MTKACAAHNSFPAKFVNFLEYPVDFILSRKTDKPEYVTFGSGQGINMVLYRG